MLPSLVNRPVLKREKVRRKAKSGMRNAFPCESGEPIPTARSYAVFFCKDALVKKFILNNKLWESGAEGKAHSFS